MTAIRDYLRQIAGYLILSVLVENLVAKKKIWSIYSLVFKSSFSIAVCFSDFVHFS